MQHSDATSAKEQFVCEGELTTQSVLSRSARLADMHRIDPEGCVCLPCNTRTWTAWLTDDPSRMTADKMGLMLDVIKVRSSYTLGRCRSEENEELFWDVIEKKGPESTSRIPSVSQKSEWLTINFSKPTEVPVLHWKSLSSPCQTPSTSNCADP
jgi:hypothetical protein